MHRFEYRKADCMNPKAPVPGALHVQLDSQKPDAMSLFSRKTTTQVDGVA